MILNQTAKKAIMSVLNQIKGQHQNLLFTFSSQQGDSSNDNNNKIPKKKITKEDVYIHKVNYNQEQYKNYTQEVKNALDDLEQTNQKLENSTAFELLPRRKRRIYDRPLHDLDISNYECWRTFDKQVFKTHKHAARVVCKINLSPRALRHAFGEGVHEYRNDRVSTREYDFEDSNMDAFLIYDYKATTGYHGDKVIKNDNIENSENTNDQDKAVKKPYPTPEEFWNSDEPHVFRVNCNNYADYHKFKKWIQTEVEKRASEKSYEEKILEKFGPYELYDKYEKSYELVTEPSVFKYGREYYQDKGKKFSEKEIEQNPYLKPLKPAKQMEDKYRVAWPYQWNPKPSQ